MVDDEDFNPDDIAELEAVFHKIESASDESFVVEFHMSKLDAEEMVAEWVEAMMGSKPAIKACLRNYGHLIKHLMEVLKYMNEPPTSDAQ